MIPDWRDWVSILLLLAGVFPSQSERICNTILEVMSGVVREDHLVVLFYWLVLIC